MKFVHHPRYRFSEINLNTLVSHRATSIIPCRNDFRSAKSINPDIWPYRPIKENSQKIFQRNCRFTDISFHRFRINLPRIVTAISSAYTLNEHLIFSFSFLPPCLSDRVLINLFNTAFARPSSAFLTSCSHLRARRYAYPRRQPSPRENVSGSGARCKIVRAFGNLPKQATSETTPTLCHRRDINPGANNAGDICVRSLPPSPLFDFATRYANHGWQSLDRHVRGSDSYAFDRWLPWIDINHRSRTSYSQETIVPLTEHRSSAFSR